MIGADRPQTTKLSILSSKNKGFSFIPKKNSKIKSTMENSAQEINSPTEGVVGRRKEALWVFGYGSLCWNPGFEYQQSVCGFVKGFSRRFWQGNTTHRGTDSKVRKANTLTLVLLTYPKWNK